MVENKDTKDTTQRKSLLFEKSGLHYAKSQMISEIKSKISRKILIEEAQDYLIYGLDIRMVDENGKINEGIIYIKPNEDNILTFLNKETKKSKNINLYKLIDLTYGKSTGYFNLVNAKEMSLLNEKCCITLHLNDFKFVDFILYEEIKLNYFSIGILSFLEKNIKDSKYQNSDLLSLKKIWKEYDVNHSKFLNLEQFSKFLLNINFKWKKKSNEEIFNEIDKKKAGKINFKDFLFFYEKIVTGEEFREVFQKYSSDPKKKYINLKGLMDFLEKEQKQKISIEEASDLIRGFSNKYKNNTNNPMNNPEKETPDNIVKHHESIQNIYENYMTELNEEDKENINNLKLNFREFVNVLVDRNINSVYNNSFFAIHQNMDLPLNYYYIYSSHNTYLTGNQMVGASSIEMYNYCLKNGCRLVEIDCWDSAEGPIVTHWHFPVSKLKFKDVLINIKKFAFQKSKFPVILSVENHCNEANQTIMYNDFLDVFSENELFIIDTEHPPLIYPSPNSLQNRIIIKCRRKRFLQNVVISNSTNLLKNSPITSLQLENNLVPNNSPAFNSTPDHNILNLPEKNVDKNNLVKPSDIIPEIEEGKSKENSMDEGDLAKENMNDLSINVRDYKLKSNIEIKNFSNKELIAINKETYKKYNSNKLDLTLPDRIIEQFKGKLGENNEKEPQIHSDNLPNTTDKERVLKTIGSDGKPIPQKSTKLIDKMAKNTFHFKIDYVEDQELKLKHLNIDLKEGESFFTNNNHIIERDIETKNNHKYVHSFVSDSERNSEIESEIGTLRKGSNTIRNELIKKLKTRYSDKLNSERKKAKSINLDDNKSIKEAFLNLKELQSKKKMEKHNTISTLSSIIGMIGIPFDTVEFDNMKNLPWEIVSLSEPEFNLYTKTYEGKLRVVRYTQISFLKVYPDIFRTDSSNHNPIRSWLYGTQISALNLQKTDDDFILINKIFFKINGGSRSGYILKPEILRNPNISLDQWENRYIRPAFKIKFKVLSGFHLHNCFPSNTKIKGLYVEVSMRGSEYDDENPKLITSTIVENFLHPVWKSNSVEFEVYDPELSFFVVKLFSKGGKHILARGVIPMRILNLGYRILDLYDNHCTKFEQSFLIVKTNKIFV